MKSSHKNCWKVQEIIMFVKKKKTYFTLIPSALMVLIQEIHGRTSDFQASSDS